MLMKCYQVGLTGDLAGWTAAQQAWGPDRLTGFELLGTGPHWALSRRVRLWLTTELPLANQSDWFHYMAKAKVDL